MCKRALRPASVCVAHPKTVCAGVRFCLASVMEAHLRADLVNKEPQTSMLACGFLNGAFQVKSHNLRHHNAS